MKHLVILLLFAAATLRPALAVASCLSMPHAEATEEGCDDRSMEGMHTRPDPSRSHWSADDGQSGPLCSSAALCGRVPGSAVLALAPAGLAPVPFTPRTLVAASLPKSHLVVPPTPPPDR